MLEMKIPGFSPEPGKVYDGLPPEVYHAAPGISLHGLLDLARSPMHYRHRRAHPKPSTPEQSIGTALHTLILEPDQFETRYTEAPDLNKNSKAWKEWLAALPEGVTPLKKETIDRLHQCAEVVRNHHTVMPLLDSGRAERSYWWVDPETRRLCRARMDWFSEGHDLIVDLKKCRDASLSGFTKACGQYRYHVQAAFYADGWYWCTGRPVSGFVFVAVEDEPPYGVGVYTIGEEEMRCARLEYRALLQRYSICLRDDEWPGYPPEIRILELPAWALRSPAS